MSIESPTSAFQLLFEHSGDIVLLLSPAADGPAVIRDVNAATCDQHGYTREELIGRPISFLARFSTPELIATRIREALEKGCTTFDARHARKDGSIFEAEVMASRVRFGSEDFVLTVDRDLTGRRRAEKERESLQNQLLHSQKMESIGRLAGGVAHDFNNMLSVIIGHAELALEMVDTAQPLYSDLVEIRTAAERSASLTQQLLAFARKQPVSPRVIDLDATVESMAKMLRRLIGEAITLRFQPGTQLFPIKMDRAQVHQILANLCVNARDAIEGVGTVSIATENVTLHEARVTEDGHASGDYVTLSVRDDGCGMDEEQTQHLFEPFFTTKPQGKGTGLGLATVYGIVKQNGGFIEVRSKPGAGTTMVVYLPRHTGSSGSGEHASHAPEPGKETVLLVEDEPAILRVTQRMLERLGYRVWPAGTPNEALHLAEQHLGDIELLVADVVMPEMNGRELAERLTARIPGLRRLYMSGYTADVIAQHGVLEEGVHFVQKPFTATELAAKVRAALAG